MDMRKDRIGVFVSIVSTRIPFKVGAAAAAAAAAGGQGRTGAGHG